MLMLDIAELPASIQETYRRQRFVDIQREVREGILDCLAIDDLLSLIEDAEEPYRRVGLIDHIDRSELSDPHFVRISGLIKRIALKSELLPSREKLRADSALRALVGLLPSDVAELHALEFLVHPRKARRTIAFKILKRTGLTIGGAKYLLVRFEETGDQELLELIARCPRVVSESEPIFLLEHISEPYWRMRVMEGLLMHKQDMALDLSGRYSREFVHAVGRQESAEHAPRVEALARQHWDDPDFLSLYAWCLRKLRDPERLIALDKHLMSRVADSVDA